MNPTFHCVLAATMGVFMGVAGCASTPQPQPTRASPQQVTNTPPPETAGIGLGQIDDAGARAALGDWLKERALASQPGRRFNITSASGVDNWTDAIVVERIQDSGSCVENTLKVGISHGDGAVEEAFIGADCCGDKLCPERDLVGWMLRLDRLRAQADWAGVSAIFEAGGVTVTSEWMDDEEDALVEKKEQLTRERVAKGDLGMLSRFDPLYLSISCDGVAAPGLAACRVGAGGVQETWNWKVEGDQAWLVSVSLSGH